MARASHGVVTRAELERAGITPGEIKERIRRGTLRRQHRGVYRVGHNAPSIEATFVAAVRACGTGAVLSGLSAAYLHGIVKRPPTRVQVTSPARLRLRGVWTRQSKDVGVDATTVRGIRVTAVARTLVDLAAELGEDDLARACHEAGVRHRTTPAQVEAVLARRPNAPGAGALRRIIRGDVRVTLSKLEARFLGRLREAGLPLPRTNRVASERRVDCRWADRRLTVELDSYRYHQSRHAWEQDRRREREAYARGDQFRRYTWGDVFERPGLMMAELRALLG